MRNFALLCLLTFLCTSVRAQIPARPTSGELHAEIQKLQVLGSALYMAAHPDDENTRLIAYLANVEKVETAYLSLTRGDGGQNLIAPDIRELLGLTRTQELLAARRTDGGTQFFSRANDFGYSKHPDETFNIWDKQDVLADAVWVIRKWRPDVIVLRFDPRAPGTTHGHHTASAIIGQEAFDLAGDPTAFPEQLKYVKPWQPRRIYWNAYTWRGVPEHMRQDKIIKVDVGTYLPKLGEGVAEIAARSRSQHRSQGFGSAGSRGEQIEQLELLKGDDKDAEGEVFANIDVSWNRIGAGRIGQALQAIEQNFNFDDPSASVPALLRVRGMIRALPDGFWKTKKLGELDELIANALGLYLFAKTDDPIATAGQELEIDIEATNRSQQPVKLIDYFIDGTHMTRAAVDQELAANRPFRQTDTIQVLTGKASSGPYWLKDSWKLGMYTVKDQAQRGKGESDDPLNAVFTLDIAGEQFEFVRPVRHAFTDRVMGEQVQPLEIMPPVFGELDKSSYLFTTSEPSPIRIKVTSARANISGTVELCTPENWSVTPKNKTFTLTRKGEEQYFEFMLTPPADQEEGMIVPLIKLDGEEDSGYTRKLIKIEHDHIPTQFADLDASAPVAKLDLKVAGRNIGYLPGAGDAIPEALTNIGLNVTTLNKGTIATGDLSRFDAIVVGIRAYNTEADMPNMQPRLLKYVENGGTLVVQYNTSRGLKLPMTEIGPYPLQLSRDRTTVEEAPVRILAPDHPVLNYPNKITSKDFDGWVQERGLYFPNNWDERYTPIISSNDPGEDPHDGGLLVAEYGKGHYVYTGYSFFRELPAGVPGAYRLFANLVGLGNEVRP
ncbi:PIG-L family deacetylase [Neolewinella agarilytica]|uniref:PIG-L family deacetylase n=1 Tax=Neolewinella agarilytica TaxID=478744 RepID=UPI002352B876|nr:PIG-L family deacetylase [Neolewinella agarilytica]